MQTFAALHWLFRRCSERKPLVVVIEDVHWIDATSKEYLCALASRPTAQRLLLILTLRPGYQLPWQTQSNYGQLPLVPLVDEESRVLVRATRRGPPLQMPLETQIVVRAQGNPFFLEALTQSVTEQVEQTPALDVPDTIHSILAARIDRLPMAATLRARQCLTRASAPQAIRLPAPSACSRQR